MLFKMNYLIPFGNKHFLKFFIDNILSIKKLLKCFVFCSINGIDYYEVSI